MPPSRSIHVFPSSAGSGRGLGQGGVALGIAIGGGALASSGLILIAPSVGADPLLFPIVVAAVAAAGHLLAVVLLLPEHRAIGHVAVGPALRSIPAGLVAGARVLTGSRVLMALVAVELFGGFGMWAFESLTPVRLGEVLGDADAAAAAMGPVVAGGWLLFAAGSAAAERLARRLDVAVIALVFRVAQGATVVAIGLAAGPAGAISAYLGCYLVHGGSGPLHNTLLHREVQGPTRATVLSINSMVAHPSASLGAIVLGSLATDSSVSLAFVVAGVVLALAAPLYIPAIVRRREDQTGSST